MRIALCARLVAVAAIATAIIPINIALGASVPDYCIYDLPDVVVSDVAGSELQTSNSTVLGVEGTPVTLNASHVFDPPAQNTRYRWDFESDGSWDTGWSSSEQVNHVWGDDFSGKTHVATGEAYDMMDIEVEAPYQAFGSIEWIWWTAQAFAPGKPLLTKVSVAVTVNWGQPSDLHAWIRETLEPSGANLSHGSLPYTKVPRGYFTSADEWPVIDMDDVVLQVNKTYFLVLNTFYSPTGIYWRHHVGDVRPEWPEYGGNLTRGWSPDSHQDLGFRTYTEDVTRMDEGNIDVRINNTEPIISILPNSSLTVSENSKASIAVSAIDEGSDDLTFTWNWGDGSPDTTTVYYNDGIGPDSYPSPGGTYPFSIEMTTTHVYGDDGVFPVTLTIEDDDGGVSFSTVDVTVLNIPPTIEEAGCAISRPMAGAWARIAGEKWHDVIVAFYEDGVETANVTMVRIPGNPNDQEAYLGLIDGSSDIEYSVAMWYTPEDDSVNGQPQGATPAWIILKLEDGTETEVHHLFNVNHPETWSWRVDNVEDVVPEFVTCTAVASDPGSDDITFIWDVGDGRIFMMIVYNNGIGPDPYPSPEVNPITATSTVTFSRPATSHQSVTLTVLDDDGGSAVRTFNLHVRPVEGAFVGFDVSENDWYRTNASAIGILLSAVHDEIPPDPPPRTVILE